MQSRWFQAGRALQIGAFAGTLALGAAHAGPGPSWQGGGNAALGCQPDWIPAFGALAPFDSGVQALVQHDDGSGPSLFVGGSFTSIGDQALSYLARWDGTTWSAVGGGVNDRVEALAVFDDGSGPALFAAGWFSSAGGVPAQRIAKWNGIQWAPLGTGVDQPGHILALEVFDSGLGAELYAGGQLTSVGGVAVGHIARWDGASWSAVSSGVDGPVHALEAFDPGTGPGLFVGGTFSSAGGAPAANIARWDGGSWGNLGSGVSGWVRSLRVFDGGGGAELHAGGTFGTAGGLLVSNIARWNGAAWASLGNGTNGSVKALEVFDDGSGSALIAGGAFTNAGGIPAGRAARWRGGSWSSLQPGHAALGGLVEALAVFDDGSGPVLHAGSLSGLHAWSGTRWVALTETLNGTVRALEVFADSGGPALYAGGDFTGSGDVDLRHIGRWDGAAWAPLGAGTNQPVHAFAVFDDGSGPALYVGGAFTNADGVVTGPLARWDGAAWSRPGAGLTGSVVKAMVVFDDGSGPALYVGGYLNIFGGSFADVARWDGSTWTYLIGLTPSSGLDGGVNALAVFDGGSGPALFAGGGFTVAGSAPAGRVARWDGGAWSPAGGGLGLPGERVFALQVFDDLAGAGSALYAGGDFGGVSRFNGLGWSTVGAPFEGVRSFAVFNAGAGNALYAGSAQAGPGAARDHIERWNGTAWSSLGSDVGASVEALAVYDDGSGAALFAGGAFTTSASGDAYAAKFGGCPTAIAAPYCFGSAALCPCANVGAPQSGCANSSGQGATLVAAGSASVVLDDLVLSSHDLPAAQPALLFGADMVVNGGLGAPFGDGLRCAGGNVLRLGIVSSSGGGVAQYGPGLVAQAGYAAGDTARFQVHYRDPAGSPCGQGFNLTHGLEILFH